MTMETETSCVEDADSQAIDCLIVGYHDSDFDRHATLVRPLRHRNGAYHAIISNSVSDHGRRVPYMDLLNRCFEDLGRHSPGLHVCKLPNLGVAYLANYLIHHGLRCEIINFLNEDREHMAQLFASRPVLAVAVTTTFYTTSQPVKEVVGLIRSLSSTVKIIVGGPYVFNLCEKSPLGQVDAVLEDIGADIYVHESQGEKTLVDVLRALKRSADLDDIPNIIVPGSGPSLVKSAAAQRLLSSGRVRRTRRVHEDNDMDLYSVNWQNFPRSYFVPTVQLRTARSCAYKCAFCCYPIMAGELALTSLEVIERQLEYLHNCGVRNLVFIDDTFNIPQNRFKALCRMMIRRRFGFQWFSYFRAANADREAIDLAADSGCKGVFLGIESGDQDMLIRMNKAAKVEKYVTGIQRLNRLGVFTFVSLIVGFPGETAESVRNTMSFIGEAQPSCYRAELYFHSVNTPIHAQADALKICGSGYAWTHATMQWREAADHIVSMYNEIQDCPVIAEHMFDFWAVPYLVGKGFEISQIDRFLRATHPYLLRSMLEDPFDPEPYKDRVRQALIDVRLNSCGFRGT